MFILFEGFEAVGKTTNAKRLVQHFLDADGQAFYTREPGGDPIAEKIRDFVKDPANAGVSALAEFFLFQASRAQFVQRVLRPALEAGEDVVLDRYSLSTMAYQIAGRQLPMAQCLNAIELATGGLVPDITFLLTCSYERSRARQKAEQRQMDRLEQEAEKFHRTVLSAYEDFARLLPAWNIHIIRTDSLPQEEVFARVLDILRAEMGIIS